MVPIMADICHNRPDPPRQNISTKHQRELYLFFLGMSYFRNKKYIIQKAKLEGNVDLFNLLDFLFEIQRQPYGQSCFIL